MQAQSLPDPESPGHAKTKGPTGDHHRSAEMGHWVGCVVLDRALPVRARHQSITQIQSDLWDDYGIKLSDDSIARHVRHYHSDVAPGISPVHNWRLDIPRQLLPDLRSMVYVNIEI